MADEECRLGFERAADASTNTLSTDFECRCFRSISKSAWETVRAWPEARCKVRSPLQPDML
eukprot:2711467-Prymnesium_polylepis.1